MGQLLASKVIVEEESPKLPTFAAGETGIAAFIGTAVRGPIGVATLISSWEEFYLKFGGHGSGFTLPKALEGYFRNKALKCYVVRTCHYSNLSGGVYTAAKGTYTLPTEDVADAPAEFDGTQAGPTWFFQAGETLIAKIEASADKTLTLAGISAKITGNPVADPFPWTPAVPMTILLNVNAKGVQTLTIPGNGIIAYANAGEVADAIQTQLQDAQAYEGAAVKNLVFETGRHGSGASVACTGGTAAATLGLTGLTNTGTGNAADLSAVTFAEIKALLEATWIDDLPALNGVVVTLNTNNTLHVETELAGAAASIQCQAGSTGLARVGFDQLLHEGDASAPVDTLLIEGKTEGAYTADVKIRIMAASSGEAECFNLVVKYKGITVEVFPNLTMDDTDTQYVETVVNHTSTGSNYISATDLDAGLGTPTLDRPANSATEAGDGPLTGGNDGLVGLVDNDFIGSTASDTALYAMDMIQDFDLLAVPERNTAAVQKGMIDYAVNDRSRRVFCVLGPSAGLSATQVITYVETTATLLQYSEQGAFYWPRVKMVNPDKSIYGTDDELTVDPVGHICGMFSRNDNRKVGGIYEQPANSEYGVLLGVTNLETDQAKKEKIRDLVYPKMINPITVLPGTAIHVDGSRTLKSTGDFPSVAERRGVSYIEKTIQLGLVWAKHRNNDTDLRQTVNRSVKGFLVIQMKAGAFRSTDPATAFFVDTSDAINTPDVIFAKQLKVRIGLATQKPAEFVILWFSQFLADLEASLAG